MSYSQKFTVDDVKIGDKDLAGDTIEDVFSKSGTIFAVYRTKTRLLIQYADDLVLADQQRDRMKSLNELRTKINGLVDGWRYSRISQFHAKARYYDSRVAAALVMCLQNDGLNALIALTETKDDILAERQSWGRFEYLLSASIIMLSAVFLFTLVNHGEFLRPLLRPLAANNKPLETTLWLGAKAGVVGAFFSIALAIRSRTILTSLNRRDNVGDGVLRIVVGAISGGVLMLLLASDMVPAGFMIGTAAISPKAGANWQTLLLIAFVAGFIERLVPDMLAKADPSGNANHARVAAAAAAAAAAPQPAAASEQPDPTISNVTVTVGGVPGAPTDVGPRIVRLVIEGHALAKSATFKITYPAATAGAGRQVLSLTPQNPSAYTVDAAPAYQGGTSSLYSRLTLNVATAAPDTHPPAWASAPAATDMHTRTLTLVNPDGKAVAWPF